MTPIKPDNILDQWILARLRETTVEATKNADNYRISHAIEPIIGFVGDLSNWYIRRSRRRFWKSQNDEDKQNAYRVLHCCLMQTCQLLAPWTPFISDWLWRQLTVGMEAAESVHLSDWPSVKEPDDASRKVLEDMAGARQIITEGLAQRAAAKIKVRQPLASVNIKGRTPVGDDLQELIAEELNVKEVNYSISNEIEVTPDEQLSLAETVILNTDVTPELKAEGIARDLVRGVQSARKKAGFNVQDRIKLRLDSPSDDITGAITRFKDLIFAETLATAELAPQSSAEHTESVQIDGQEVTLSLSRQ